MSKLIGRNEVPNLERSWVGEFTGDSKASVGVEVAQTPTGLFYGDQS